MRISRSPAIERRNNTTHHNNTTLTRNSLNIDRLVHFRHGLGGILHGVGHGLVRLDGLQLERTALQVTSHFNEFGNVLPRAHQILDVR
jgi:hypothetical protein